MQDYSRYRDDQQPSRGHRGAVLRMALFFSACLIACLAIVVIAVVNILQGHYGHFIMFTMFAFIGFLTGFQARNYLRDLKAEPIHMEGEIRRKWHKGNLFLFFMPSYYVLVEERVFSIGREEYAAILEEDLIRIRCYPHSLTVQNIERYDELRQTFVPAASGDPF